MQHRMTVGADRHKVFLIINLVVFSNSGERNNMMNMYKTTSNLSINLFEIHTTNCTLTSFQDNAFLSCFGVPFIPIYQHLTCMTLF